MKIKKLNFEWTNKQKGQAFVELTLVFLVLLTLLVGMVEFGNLLNQYINIVDGAREGARLGSNDDPTEATSTYTSLDGVDYVGWDAFYNRIFDTVQGNGVSNLGAINPIVLNPDTDNIVISVYSVTGNLISGYQRKELLGTGNNHKYNNSKNDSKFSTGDIDTLVAGTAPSTGILLVEIFYSYNQILKFFYFLPIPDPIEIHAYSFMPLSSAEPTPTLQVTSP